MSSQENNKNSRRWLRYSLQSAAGLAVLLVLTLAMLLGTHAGNNILLQIVQQIEPRLSVTLSAGSLTSGATFDKFRWSSQGADLMVSHLEIEWDWQKIFNAELVIQRLLIADGRLALSTETDPSATDQAEKEAGELSLPFDVKLQNLQLEQVDLDLYGQRYILNGLRSTLRYDQAGLFVPELQLARGILDIYGMKIDLSELQSALQFNGNKLKISPLQLQAIQVHIPPAEAAEPTVQTAGKKESLATRVALPEIVIPLVIEVDGFAAENALLDSPSGEFQAQKITFSGKTSGSQVSIVKLSLLSQQFALQAVGEIELTADYPLTLDARGKILDLPPVNDTAFQITGRGSVADLVLGLSTSGPFEMSLQGTLQPLDPLLPFSAKLDWHDIQWPVQQPQLLSEQGELSVQGNLQGYSYQVAGLIVGDELPAIDLRAHGEGDSSQLRVNSAELAALNGEASLVGSLDWREGLSWQGELSLKNLDPAELLPELPGRVSGNLHSRFSMRDDNWQLLLRKLHLTGTLASQPLDLQGEIEGHSTGEWRLDRLQLLSGTNRLFVDGHFGTQSALQGSLKIVDLQTSLPEASGVGSAEFLLSGPREALNLSYRIDATSLRYAGQQIAALVSSGELILAANPSGTLTLSAQDLSYENVRFSSLEASLAGDADDHQLKLEIQGESYSIDTAIIGTLIEQTWKGQIQHATLATQLGLWSLEKAVEVDADLQTMSVQLPAHCWTSEPASLCLNESTRVGSSGQISLTLKEFSSSQVASLLPAGFAWEGTIAANVDAGWEPGEKPVAKANLTTDNGYFLLTQAEQQLKAEYRQIAIQVALDDAGLDLSLALNSEQLGQGNASLQLALYQEERPVQGDFNLSGLQLGILRPLINSQVKLSGVIDVHTSLSGPLKQPQVLGTITLQNGHLVGPQLLPMGVDKANLKIKFDGYQANLSGDLLLGDGAAGLAGEFNWRQPPATAWLTLKGEKNRFLFAPSLDLLINPDLRLELQQQVLALTGSILIPYGRIKVKTLPQGAVRLSDDVLVLDDPNATKGTHMLPLTMSLEARLSDDVLIEAFGLKSELFGALSLKQELHQPLTGNGNIELEKGTYRAFGQNLLINKGSLLFSGPLSKPFIDVDAIRDPNSTSDDVIAGVRLRGAARTPEVSIYSEPSMSQQEAISYLLRGRSLGSSSGSSQDTMVATMLIGAGVGRSEGAISELGQMFGIKDLAVDTQGGGTDTKVEVSGYLLPGVQVGYGVGVFSPVTEVTLRYEVLPKLVLEAVSGLQSAIDVLYEFEY